MKALRLALAFIVLWSAASAAWAQLFFTPPPPQQRNISGTPTIAWVSSATGQSTANTVVITAPVGGWLTGDVLIVGAQYDSSGSNGRISVPSPCVELDFNAVTYTGDTEYCVIGAVPPVTLTWQPVSDTAVSWAVDVEEYSGVNTSTPINAHSIKTNNGTKTISATAITTTVVNTVVVYMIQAFNEASTVTFISTPSTFTARGSIYRSPVDSLGAGMGNAAFDKAVAATGSVASQSAAMTASGSTANSDSMTGYIALTP